MYTYKYIRIYIYIYPGHAEERGHAVLDGRAGHQHDGGRGPLARVRRRRGQPYDNNII